MLSFNCIPAYNIIFSYFLQGLQGNTSLNSLYLILGVEYTCLMSNSTSLVQEIYAMSIERYVEH